MPSREGKAPDDAEWLASAREYHRPTATPSEAIWRGIEERIRPEGVVPISRARRSAPSDSGRSRWGAWLLAGSAAAALVVAGIGIGRMTVPTGTALDSGAPPDALAEPGRTASPAVRVVALEHLGRSGSLLEMVRADARTGRIDPDLARWSGALLAETRLLLDSPAGDDPTMRALLEDLELILAQMAVLRDGSRVDDARARTELQLVAEGVERRDVLSRIRTVLPSDAEAGMTGI